MNFDKFILINDFTAAGYGVSTLTPKDSVPLGDSANAPMLEGEKSVKLVIGAGTGLGQGILIKSEEEGYYEPYPTEGGHVDFSVQT